MRRLLPLLLIAGLLSAQTKSSDPNAVLLTAPDLPAAPPMVSEALRPKPSELIVPVNKSFVLQNGVTIRRISVANGEIAEALAVSTTEVLLNGKAPGDTSLIVWDQRGARTAFEVHVVQNDSKLDAVRDELQQEVGPGVKLKVEDANVFLRGTVPDTITADRALAIASTLGKVTNLLRVLVPPGDPQILLKVRFADIDRSATSQLGANLFSLDNGKGIASSTTGQFGAPPAFDFTQKPATLSLNQLLNIFFYRPDINLGAIIQDLEAKQVLQILAEPNLLTVSGRPASFLAGGEFPFPTLQGGAAGIGQITIQFKEFGIRLNFLPTVTPRGTIRLIVTPEVSSLDYTNGLTVSGYTVPGLATRRVQTEIELQNGQSFVIAGLLDNQLTQAINKMPGLANIPVLGKLFQSRSMTKSNNELLVMVTPELVKPIPAEVRPPEVDMPIPFLPGTAPAAPQNPIQRNAPLPKTDSLPVEELEGPSAPGAPAGAPSNPPPSAPPFGLPPGVAIQPNTQNTASSAAQTASAAPKN